MKSGRARQTDQFWENASRLVRLAASKMSENAGPLRLLALEV